MAGEQLNQEHYTANAFETQILRLKELNDSALSEGKNGLGSYIGPAELSESNKLEPIFVLSKPVDKVEEIEWGDKENRTKGHLLVRRYIMITPNGPMAVRFNKKIVNADGETSLLHSGPGANTDLDFDDIEGGEKGTFLPLLQDGANSSIRRGPFGKVDTGLSVDESGDPILVLGNHQSEAGVYTIYEQNDTWGIETEVGDELIEESLKQSKELSKTTKVKDTEGKTEQAELIQGILDN